MVEFDNESEEVVGNVGLSGEALANAGMMASEKMTEGFADPIRSIDQNILRILETMVDAFQRNGGVVMDDGLTGGAVSAIDMSDTAIDLSESISDLVGQVSASLSRAADELVGRVTTSIGDMSSNLSEELGKTTEAVSSLNDTIGAVQDEISRGNEDVVASIGDSGERIVTETRTQHERSRSEWRTQHQRTRDEYAKQGERTRESLKEIKSSTDSVTQGLNSLRSVLDRVGDMPQAVSRGLSTGNAGQVVGGLIDILGGGGAGSVVGGLSGLLEGVGLGGAGSALAGVSRLLGPVGAVAGVASAAIGAADKIGDWYVGELNKSRQYGMGDDVTLGARMGMDARLSSFGSGLSQDDVQRLQKTLMSSGMDFGTEDYEQASDLAISSYRERGIGTDFTAKLYAETIRQNTASMDDLNGVMRYLTDVTENTGLTMEQAQKSFQDSVSSLSKALPTEAQATGVEATIASMTSAEDLGTAGSTGATALSGMLGGMNITSNVTMRQGVQEAQAAGVTDLAGQMAYAMRSAYASGELLPDNPSLWVDSRLNWWSQPFVEGGHPLPYYFLFPNTEGEFREAINTLQSQGGVNGVTIYDLQNILKKTGLITNDQDLNDPSAIAAIVGDAAMTTERLVTGAMAPGQLLEASQELEENTEEAGKYYSVDSDSSRITSETDLKDIDGNNALAAVVRRINMKSGNWQDKKESDPSLYSAIDNLYRSWNLRQRFAELVKQEYSSSGSDDSYYEWITGDDGERTYGVPDSVIQMMVDNFSDEAVQEQQNAEYEMGNDEFARYAEGGEGRGAGFEGDTPDNGGEPSTEGGRSGATQESSPDRQPPSEQEYMKGLYEFITEGFVGYNPEIDPIVSNYVNDDVLGAYERSGYYPGGARESLEGGLDAQDIFKSDDGHSFVSNASYKMALYEHGEADQSYYDEATEQEPEATGQEDEAAAEPEVTEQEPEVAEQEPEPEPLSLEELMASNPLTEDDDPDNDAAWEMMVSDANLMHNKDYISDEDWAELSNNPDTLSDFMAGIYNLYKEDTGRSDIDSEYFLSWFMGAINRDDETGATLKELASNPDKAAEIGRTEVVISFDDNAIEILTARVVEQMAQNDRDGGDTN